MIFSIRIMLSPMWISIVHQNAISAEILLQLKQKYINVWPIQNNKIDLFNEYSSKMTLFYYWHRSGGSSNVF